MYYNLYLISYTILMYILYKGLGSNIQYILEYVCCVGILSMYI